MKTLFTLLITMVCLHQTFAQQVSNFKERTFLWKTDSSFRTLKRDPKVVLKVLSLGSKKLDTLASFKGKMNNQEIVLYQVDSIENDQNAKTFVPSNSFESVRFFGEIKQEKNKLMFYPWPFKGEDTSANVLIKKNKFFINIPERTVVAVPYNAWHFGTLTLPAKVYLGTRADTLKNNIEFGANLNFMIGRKWGKKKYYYLPNEESGTTYDKAFSFNLILGIGKLTVDGTNTKPKTTESLSVANLSYGFAFGIQHKKVGLFLATGFDSPLSKLANNWNYKWKPWLGFGFGLGLN